jgi:hypothetical protein
MHRARHSGASAILRRPRVLILLAVGGLGLAAALWLPTRNDSASATENGRSGQHSQQHRNGGDGQRISWPVFPNQIPKTPPSIEPPSSEPPSYSEPPYSEPPVSESPSSEPPTSAPPTLEPPTSAPPATTAPPTAPPTSKAPAARAWAPFTDYTAGQLVKFKGVVYQVQQTHTSLPGWEPPKLPKLFKVV